MVVYFKTLTYYNSQTGKFYDILNIHSLSFETVNSSLKLVLKYKKQICLQPKDQCLSLTQNLLFLIVEKKNSTNTYSIPKRCSILIISSFVGMEKRNQSFHPP